MAFSSRFSRDIFTIVAIQEAAGCVGKIDSDHHWQERRLGVANTAVRRDASGSKDGVRRLSTELHRSLVHEQYVARTSWVPLLVRHSPLSILSVR
ncbi:hypothetical protein PUN28_011611 [Cardiocondyla obscurior]|uniref:Secreted protein n=1 Tax=Cardiocondyla obscurior TaxID=286306 RepID=A0AAW2FKI9_9HYME